MSECQTLREFFNKVYLPSRLATSSSKTIECYQSALSVWEKVHGADVHISSVSTQHLADFINVYSQMKYRGKSIKANTIRRHLRHIYALLRFAGPAGYRSPDAVGLISSVPYVRPPRAVKRDPRPSAETHIRAVYDAADAALFPALDYFPGDWWRALISMSLNTALRIETIFSLDWSMIQDGILCVPGEITKGKKDQHFPLLPFTINRLAYLGTRSGPIFPFDHNRSTFFREFRRLNDVAGVPTGARVTVHGIRRYVLNTFAEDAPRSVQKLGGHASSKTTMESYVSWNLVHNSIKKINLCDRLLGERRD